MSNEINLALLNRVAKPYDVSFEWDEGTDDRGTHYTVLMIEAPHLDQPEAVGTIEEAYLWFRGYEVGYKSGYKVADELRNPPVG